MPRLKPSANKLCTRAWLDMDMDKHRDRLAKIKSTVDTSSPATYSHLANRSKKEQQLEERYTKIERENRQLLKKMSYIMTHSSLDNRQKVPTRSLNSEARRRELKRIMDENQAILNRIQHRKPYYDRRKWDKHSRQHQKYLHNLKEKRTKTAPTYGKKPLPRVGYQSQTMGNRRRRSGTTGRRRKAASIKYLDPLMGETSGKKVNKQRLLKNSQSSPSPITKEGCHIDGQYVIVTVDEIQKPHALCFRTYDLDSSEQDEAKVAWADVKRLANYVDPRLLEHGNREALANSLLQRLKFREGRLHMDVDSGPNDLGLEERKEEEWKNQEEKAHHGGGGARRGKQQQQQQHGTRAHEYEREEELYRYQEEEEEEPQPYTPAAAHEEVHEEQHEPAREPAPEPEPEVKDYGVGWKVELSFKCSKLEKKDWFSGSDPAVVVFKQNASGEMVFVGRTERIKNDHDPTFARTVLLDHDTSGADDTLEVRVMDCDSDGDDAWKSGDVLGSSGEVNLGELLAHGTQPFALAGTDDSSVSVTARALEVGKVQVLTVKLAAKDLPKSDTFSKSDPVAALYVKRRNGDGFDKVATTEFIKDNHDPEFATELSVESFANISRDLRFGVFDADDDDHFKEDDLLGEAFISLDALVDATDASAAHTLSLSKEGKPLKKGSKLVVTRVSFK